MAFSSRQKRESLENVMVDANHVFSDDCKGGGIFLILYIIAPMAALLHWFPASDGRMPRIFHFPQDAAARKWSGGTLREFFINKLTREK
ncbi:MAG: hypothetical protein K2Y31_06280 [Burkholderiales bacterium]|jgi:hypothetical protein|nr:hypothetical protein [Burkholderiales bacterium]